MITSTVGFASMHALIRDMSAEMHPFQIAFFRNFFGMFFILPWVIRFGLQPLRTERFGLHLLRAASNVFAMLLFFYALSIAPLADVAALGFTAPLYATILTMVFLKERVGWRRWSAILIGFAGAFIVLRPGLDAATPGHIMVIISSAIWGFCLLIIKTLSRTDSSVTVTIWMVLLLAPMSLVPALFVWTWPSWQQLGLGLAIGLLGTAGQMMITQALKVAETSVVMPLRSEEHTSELQSLMRISYAVF